MAAILTALLLQATLVAPVTVPYAVSLPAVLVAAVALVDGAGSGMAFGFATGLVADLGTTHPAGVLALCWTGVGVVCGIGASRGRLRRDAVAAGCVCALAASAAILLLALVGAGGVDPWTAITHLVPVAIGDGLLGLVLIPVVRRFLRSEHLRAPHPVFTELQLEPARG
jgi:cell shape-determining protein MreD